MPSPKNRVFGASKQWPKRYAQSLKKWEGMVGAIERGDRRGCRMMLNKPCGFCDEGDDVAGKDERACDNCPLCSQLICMARIAGGGAPTAYEVVFDWELRGDKYIAKPIALRAAKKILSAIKRAGKKTGVAVT